MRNILITVGAGFTGSHLVKYFVKKYSDDRIGHDYMYAIDISKIKNELGWKPKTSIDIGLKNILNWYLND